MHHIWIVALVFFSPVTAWSAEFLDAKNHPHEQYINQLAEFGIVEGYGHGIFRPDIPINRAEFLKILMLAVFGDEEFDEDALNCFVDFVGEPQWFWPHACRAKERGIIHGYPDGTFRGAQTVNLAEALKISIEAWGLELPPYVNTPEYWYLPYFAVAEAKGLFAYFPRQGAHLLTRSEMAYTIVSMDEPLHDVKTGTPPPGATQTSSAATSVCGNGTLEPDEECDDGNLENGDGCSEICVVVPEPIRHGALRIEQRAIDASPVSAGTRKVTLLEFDAIAGRQDVELTTLTFTSASGSFSDLQQFRIVLDTDGDDVPDSTDEFAEAEGETVSFTGLSAAIKEGQSLRIALQADVRDSAASGPIAAAFATSDPRAVAGVGTADGRDLTGIEVDNGPCNETSSCWIALHTLTPQSITILGAGNLFISASAVPVPSQQLLAGTVTDDLLTLKLRAEGEDIALEHLVITGGVSTFSQLQLFLDDDAEPFAHAWVSECITLSVGQFCANTDLTLASGQERTLRIRAKLKSDLEGGISGEPVTLSLQGTSSSVETVEARGLSSQQDLTLSDGDSQAEGEIFIGRNNPGPNNNIVGPTHDTVLAKLLQVENANSDPDDSVVPTGTAIFGQFRFTAAGNENTFSGSNDVRLRRLVFQVNASNVQLLPSGFALVNMADTSTTTACTETGITGSLTVTCTDVHESSVNTHVEAGQSTVLGLQGVVLNPQMESGNSTLQASINSLGSRSAAGDISWDDEETTFDWLDVGVTNVRSTTYRNQ